MECRRSCRLTVDSWQVNMSEFGDKTLIINPTGVDKQRRCCETPSHKHKRSTDNRYLTTKKNRPLSSCRSYSKNPPCNILIQGDFYLSQGFFHFISYRLTWWCKTNACFTMLQVTRRLKKSVYRMVNLRVDHTTQLKDWKELGFIVRGSWFIVAANWHWRWFVYTATWVCKPIQCTMNHEAWTNTRQPSTVNCQPIPVNSKKNRPLFSSRSYSKNHPCNILIPGDFYLFQGFIRFISYRLTWWCKTNGCSGLVQISHRMKMSVDRMVNVRVDHTTQLGDWIYMKFMVRGP
jgi:hypothetical protein